jgi:4-hydroxybenzoate polyprenyltransferase
VLVLVAGGAAGTAVVAGAAMFLLQSAIGASNDVLDAAHDRAHRPGKPIPSGVVSIRTAVMIAVVASSTGVLLAWLMGRGAVVVAVLGLASGLVYDAWLKRTMLSWVPFAVGLPLLPVYAWLAATGIPPAAPVPLFALGAFAGAALALANGIVDLDTDTAGEGGGLAAHLGHEAALRALVGLQGAVVVAIGFGVAAGGGPGRLARVLLVAAGAALIGAGVLGSRAHGRTARRLGWEAQAAGTVVLATAWLAGASTGG